MIATIKKIIKEDKDKSEIQATVKLSKEDHIILEMAQNVDIHFAYELTYNQLCSLSRLINSAIDKHYQEFSNTMEKEKTSKIYIDDPIDW